MSRQSRVVLLAEDDDCIRETVADYLEGLSIHVLQASDAQQAIRLLEQSADDIDMLFTDVKMPGSIDGMQLAEFVTVTWPSVAVLISSGHIRPNRQEIPPRSLFLAKPYTFPQLDIAMKELIADFLLRTIHVN